MKFETAQRGICAPLGFTAAGIRCGIRAGQTKKDLAIIKSDVPCNAAAVYTQNKVCGAPITVTRAHIADGTAQAVVVNSGNANTCNADGIEKAELMCALTANALGLADTDIIVASTGVIGEPIVMEPIENGIAALAPLLSREGGTDAAAAIMTTDTRKKEIAVTFTVGGKKASIGAIAKGSGMIHPNMATMLCFITTDVSISAAMLKSALTDVVNDTINMISVDGDTSTNDTTAIMANGLAGNAEITERGIDFDAFHAALYTVLEYIAKNLAADGEGATKLLQCDVTGAPTKTLAKLIAKSVICSSLVKTAIFGEDANWGRILCAIGYTDGDFRIDTVDVDISSAAGTVAVCRDGSGIPFSEEAAKDVLGAKEILLRVDMKQGNAFATAWGCDLTYDYVKINGDYRT